MLPNHAVPLFLVLDNSFQFHPQHPFLLPWCSYCLDTLYSLALLLWRSQDNLLFNVFVIKSLFLPNLFKHSLISSLLCRLTLCILLYHHISKSSTMCQPFSFEIHVSSMMCQSFSFGIHVSSTMCQSFYFGIHVSNSLSVTDWISVWCIHLRGQTMTLFDVRNWCSQVN